MQVFNVKQGLLHVLGWLLWRDPVTVANKAKREPRPPRRPTLAVMKGTVPDDIFAVVRTTWFKRGRPSEVDQFVIPECDQAFDAFHYTVGQALRNGADVSVITAYTAESLGIPQ
jgi:hypothetical protein